MRKFGLLPEAEDEKRRKVSTAEAQRRRERRGIRELSLPLRPLRSLRLCGEGILGFRNGQQADTNINDFRAVMVGGTMNLEHDIARMAEQERRLRFDRFDQDTAWDLGVH